MNIAILTDTNSGIFPTEGQAHGIHVLPMPVILDGKTYYEGVDLTAEAFYKHLEQGGQVSTSQPAPGDVLSLWEGLLADYDEVVYLPMSSGLSASCRSAIGLAEEFGGKVQVVDNHRISMTLRDAVYDAKALADQGQSAAQIKQALEETAADSMIFVGVETLKYLKASGRVTPAGAALGLPLTDVERHIYFAPEGELSPIACAYIRARGADRLCSFGDWAALSDVCDGDTARFLAAEVSDGIIAPGYTDEALEILKTKKKGNYNVVQIDPDYLPAATEHKDVFGITFEQGRNDLVIDKDMLTNIVSENKDLPENAKIDMIVALITLKYTQSNSVCYVKDGQAIGVGAGQQSRIHCTRLAGQKADNWYLRQHPKVLALQFVDDIRRPDRDNAIDVYTSDEYEDVLADGVWQNTFKVRPEVLTAEEKKAWIATQTGVTVGSDAFFPFGDNVERARKSGVTYIAEPGGSIRDDHVIATADKYGMVLAFTGARLFHH